MRLNQCQIVNLLTNFEKQSKPFNIFIGFTLIGVVGIIDFITGYELSFSLFYVLPISFVTWFINRRLGLAASFVSALVWLGADIATRHLYSHPFIPLWNSLIRLSFFVIITVLLAKVKETADRERALARIDYLTGAVNSRRFYELAQLEIDRLQRYEHPFTVVYIDIDNFKSVNDKFGHFIGDQILRTIVSSVRKHLRKTDVIARLGGDEFALLLPETNPKSAHVVLSKIQGNLLEEMRQSNWPITFSIGVLTCNVSPYTAEELVRMTDELMYSVKKNSKNAIKYATYG